MNVFTDAHKGFAFSENGSLEFRAPESEVRGRRVPYNQQIRQAKTNLARTPSEIKSQYLTAKKQPFRPHLAVTSRGNCKKDLPFGRILLFVSTFTRTDTFTNVCVESGARRAWKSPLGQRLSLQPPAKQRIRIEHQQY